MKHERVNDVVFNPVPLQCTCNRALNRLNPSNMTNPNLACVQFMLTDQDCPIGTGLSLYIDERRGVQGNTSMRSREFPRAQPKGTPETECWYFFVLPDLSQGIDIIQFINVMKLYRYP